MTNLTESDILSYKNKRERLNKNMDTIRKQIHDLEEEYIAKSDIKEGDVVEIIDNVDKDDPHQWLKEFHPPIGLLVTVRQISISYDNKLKYHLSYKGYGWCFIREEIKIVQKKYDMCINRGHHILRGETECNGSCQLYNKEADEE